MDLISDPENSTPEPAGAAALAAAPALAALNLSDRAALLDAFADALDAATGDLVAVAQSETHLPVARLRGEVARTSGQLRLFGDVVREGGYLEAILDSADPDATPPRPDLRRYLVPIGPVAVFSASNFPFAFSVLGGDTASALAAGCPVVVKAHSAHPELSRQTMAVAQAALRQAGAPEGTLGLVEGRNAGTALVTDPAIRAVGFTGSLHGGRALLDLANSRPDPIPFYGELSAINPVIVTPAASAQNGAAIAAGLAASFTQGVGQFCTKPGLVFIPDEEIAAAIATHVAPLPAAPMLTTRIADDFDRGLSLLRDSGLTPVVDGGLTPSGDAAPALFEVRASAALDRVDTLFTECFGPVTILVRYDDLAEVERILSRLDGSLTGTVHHAPGEATAQLSALLSPHVGRLIFNGWPTGVAVGWAQHHGGPWPATNSAHTSVGATAVRRFQRPLAFQDAPADSLPPALHDDNPWRIPRRIDSVLRLP